MDQSKHLVVGGLARYVWRSNINYRSNRNIVKMYQFDPGQTQPWDQVIHTFDKRDKTAIVLAKRHDSSLVQIMSHLGHGWIWANNLEMI